MRWIFAIFFVLPLTFAFLPLAAVMVGHGGKAPEGTFILDTSEEGSAAPLATTWDALEFGQPGGSLAFRSSDGPQGATTGGCTEVPPS